MLLWVSACAAWVGGCQPSPEERLAATRSPSAKEEIFHSLRLDLEQERHPSDGQGSVELLESPPGGAVAGGTGRYRFRFEVGAPGVAVGGWIFLQVHPFWGWSTPQTVDPEAPGYTQLYFDEEELPLRARTVDQQLLGIEVFDRPLVAGERFDIVYGAGPAEARVDRYAERASPFWFSVDGDGDGVRGLLAARLAVPIRPAEPSRLVVTLPSRMAAGAAGVLRVAAIDGAGNRVEEYSGRVEVEVFRGAIDTPSFVELTNGAGEVSFVASERGVVRLRASAGELVGFSNPTLVEVSSPPIFWADLHGHSVLSDGTGTPRDYYRYAREVAGLDIAALTDHDHWGMEPLATHPDSWEQIRAATAEADRPGRFVALLGYEWTSWLHGHRHVLYFDAAKQSTGKVLSSVDTRYETPAQLWDALRGQDALTFAHHSAGGPVATNWEFAPDPELEPVTEIVSVHGSSEAIDSSAPVYSAVPGNFVRDVLDRGYRLGFIGSGDSHDGHPGLQLVPEQTVGLAAVLATELTRESVLEALRSRRTYATNGPRIVLSVTLDGQPMGAAVAPAARAELLVSAIGTAPFERAELVRSGEVVEQRIADQPTPLIAETFTLDGLVSGEYVYIRLLQTDGGAAWSSPFFVD